MSASVVKVIHFVDNGQDFLRWGLDKNGIVRTCEPFQAFVWCGMKVVNHKTIEAGEQVIVKSDGRGQMAMNHRVQHIGGAP